MASPADFPVLRTQRERHTPGLTRRPYHVCRVCGLTVEPRNSRRHAAKCARLKREDPALWTLWCCEMHSVTVAKTRKRLGPGGCRDLVARGHLVQGPVRRDGKL